MLLLTLLIFSGVPDPYTQWDVLKEINDYVVFVVSVCLNFIYTTDEHFHTDTQNANLVKC